MKVESQSARLKARKDEQTTDLDPQVLDDFKEVLYQSVRLIIVLLKLVICLCDDLYSRDCFWGNERVATLISLSESLKRSRRKRT